MMIIEPLVIQTQARLLDYIQGRVEMQESCISYGDIN
jgi:hypothetical protein